MPTNPNDHRTYNLESEEEVRKKIKKKIYRNVWTHPDGLPKDFKDLMRIHFGNVKWFKDDRKCKITVEWTE